MFTQRKRRFCDLGHYEIVTFVTWANPNTTATFDNRTLNLNKNGLLEPTVVEYIGEMLAALPL